MTSWTLRRECELIMHVTRYICYVQCQRSKYSNVSHIETLLSGVVSSIVGLSRCSPGGTGLLARGRIFSMVTGVSSQTS